MARTTNKLTDTGLRNGKYGKDKDGNPKTGNGMHSDGAGLYLRVQGSNRSWVFIYRGAAGERQEMGLGGYPAVSLGNARDLAAAARDMRAKGLDPKAERTKEREAAKEVKVAAPVVTTFRMVANDWIAVKTKGLTTAARYQGYLRNWCGSINDLPVANVGTSEIVALLTPIWDTPTGPYVRSFIERVLTRAMKLGHRPEAANPARYKDHIEELLHERNYQTTNHAALPWSDVPALMKRLAALDGVGPACFRFAILCGLRQSEARQLRWGDVHEGYILIPADRYKTRIDHVVPLSTQAQAVIDPQGGCSNRNPDDLVFKGRLNGRPLSQHTFRYLLEDLEVDCDPHGFRTSLVGYGVKNGFDNDVMQRCLGHVTLSAVHKAYNREDYFDEKRAAFDAWGAFIAPITET